MLKSFTRESAINVKREAASGGAREISLRILARGIGGKEIRCCGLG